MVTLESNPELFGGRNRTVVLLAIRLLEETWPSELSALLGQRLFSIQRTLATLEREGVIVSRQVGRTRLVSLNPRYFAHRELEALLWAIGKHDVELQKKLGARRRRPRRTGKPGL